MEKMASNSKYYAEKMHSIQGALRMSEEINAQFGFERAFGKTTEIGNSIDSDMKITKFGISFNSDGSTSFFAQLEKTSENQKDYLEKIQEKKVRPDFMTAFNRAFVDGDFKDLIAPEAMNKSLLQLLKD